MAEIKGIYAASMSIIKADFTLDIEKTIRHAENIIDKRELEKSVFLILLLLFLDFIFYFTVSNIKEAKL